jgi:Raf kinase inhibitor-like YbhB/YbcL family protein
MRFAGAGVGENISPPLHWRNIPATTAELILVMEDPDAPLATPFVHLIAAHIPPWVVKLEEGALNDTQSSLLLGRGTFGKSGYSGPRALPGHGPHRYVFQIFAASRSLRFPGRLSRRAFLEASHGTIVARGRLDGVFERK